MIVSLVVGIHFPHCPGNIVSSVSNMHHGNLFDESVRLDSSGLRLDRITKRNTNTE